MVLRHFYDGVVTQQWTVASLKEAQAIVQKRRGTKSAPRFIAVAAGYELADGDRAIYELSRK